MRGGGCGNSKAEVAPETAERRGLPSAKQAQLPAGGESDAAEPEARAAARRLSAASLEEATAKYTGVVALRGLLEAGESIEEAAPLLKGCGLRKLELGFKACEAFDGAAMQLIADNLPPELEELDMVGGGLGPAHATALASACVSGSLTSLNVGFNEIG